MSEIREREVKSASGIPMVFILLGLTVVVILALINIDMSKVSRLLTLGIGSTVLLIAFSGLYKVEPNQSAVLSLFGKYVGTVRTPGLRFNNPFFTKKKIRHN